jgi:hypothetical protein
MAMAMWGTVVGALLGAIPTNRLANAEIEGRQVMESIF